MRVDRDRFIDQGFLIIHDAIAPDKLDAMRAAYEAILDRQKVAWARDRKPDDPPGGVWETSPQPRVHLTAHGLVDASTANAVEDFWVAPETLDTCSQLLCNPEPNVTTMAMMCSPVHDHPGGTGWHRDIHPVDMAPLSALQADFVENGPRYTQWNVALYDDNVLWVIPGSHRRLNTEVENGELLEDAKKALTGGVPVELRAGDGVVYSNYLIHWGSNYTTKRRRTIHGGHAIYAHYPDLGFTSGLSATAREAFEGWARRSERMQQAAEFTLRAAIDRDAEAYRSGLESLQPGAGDSGKTVLTIYLSKAAYHIGILRNPDFDAPERAHNRAKGRHPITLNWGPEFADRFSAAQAVTLWQRFQSLDAKLQTDHELFEPGFQSGPMYYFFNELPVGVDTESFIASWANGG